MNDCEKLDLQKTYAHDDPWVQDLVYAVYRVPTINSMLKGNHHWMMDVVGNAFLCAYSDKEIQL
jgi:hypothetical protein